ncbi:hypothetical protein IF2G_00629 [Cordyceps javanica]|nr:hypothetical protein IF2G_00629 [Cordyceps javanica]
MVILHRIFGTTGPGANVSCSREKATAVGGGCFETFSPIRVTELRLVTPDRTKWL